MHVDRYVGQEDDAYLISLFGDDAEVGAINTFTVMFPDGKEKVVGFDPDAICYRGSLNLQGRKQASASDRGLNFPSCQWKRWTTFILHFGPNTRELARATLECPRI
jgi:hypothetical protein